MEKIPWNKDLQMGMGIIDDHHRQLVDLANDFIGAANTAGRPTTLTHYLTRIREHATAHLRTVESIMATCRYSKRSEHTLQNERFRMVMKQLHSHLKTSDQLADRDVEMLRESLVRHIKNSNEAIVGAMNSDSRGARPN